MGSLTLFLTGLVYIDANVPSTAWICKLIGMGNTSQEGVPSWQDLEEIGAGDGVPTECERCGKPGTPRQQFEHMGMTICYICTDERVGELRSEGGWS